MSAIVLTPSTQLCLGSGKRPGYARVVACNRYAFETEKEPKIATIFLDEKKGELRVWREKKGITRLGGAKKYATRIVYTASDGPFTAVFFHHDKGRRLGLAVMQQSSSSPARLIGNPVDYSANLDEMLIPLFSCGKKEKEVTAVFHIHRACLRQTSSGLVISAVFVTRSGEAYLVIGAFTKNIWKRFKLDASFGMPTCLRIQNDRVVSVVSCVVGSPVDHTVAVKAPTVELALSMFQQTRVATEDYDKVNHAPLQQTEANCCVMLRESIFSVDDRDPTIRVCYQSQLFSLPQGAGGVYVAPLCLLYTDTEHQHYAAVVSLAAQSYIVHLRRSPFDMELIARCTKIGLRGLPRSVTWLRLLHSSRLEGGLQILVVLSQDYHMYAAEVFGDAISVTLDDGSNVVRFSPPPKSHISGELVLESSTESTYLYRIGDGELLCTNGILAVVLRVTDLNVQGDLPREHLLPPIIDGECSERRIATLVKSLQQVEKISKLSRSDLFQILFQQVLPMLQCAGSSQRELFLIQRVFQAVLAAAAPQTAADWRTLWGFTILLHEKLSKLNCDNSVVYTDMFFIHLVENYVHSHGTVDEQRLAEEALLSVVSDDLRHLWRLFVLQQDDNVSFVLDSLAERVSLILLAEECVRRMISVSTLSNGTHVVYAVGRTFHVIHAIGTALLASCLEVPLYVNTDDTGQLVCHTTSMGETSVFVPPISFKNRSRFEYALTLSTDLLCTTSSDTSLMPCAMALLSMLSARRYHVISAFLHVFAFPLAEYLAPLEPLCDNVSLITACSAAVSLSEAALFKKLLFKATPADILLVLCNGSLIDDCFNTGLWNQVGGIIGKNTQALIIAAVLHAMTDRLIAAQSNYSTSIVKTLLKEGLEHPFQEVSVENSQKRLGIILSRLERFWACVGAWLPYKLEDMVNSVLVSNAAVGHGRRDGQTLLSGSAVSRTYVMCFRILALVGYLYRTEVHIVELMKQATNDTSTIVRVLLLLLQAIENFKGMALPVESFQWRCVDVAVLSESMCVHAPGLAGFLLEILQLSEASRTGITSLKQYYYAVVDRLTVVAQDDEKEGSEDVFKELRAQLAKKKRAIASTNAAKTYFLWSRKGGVDVPNWPGDHSLPTRRYLINTEWVDLMWPIEFAPDLLEVCLNFAQERIRNSDITEGPAEVEPSLHFSQALFYQLCALSPPVQSYALLAPTEATGAVAKGSTQVSREANKFESRMSSPSAVVAAETVGGPPSPSLPLKQSSLNVSNEIADEDFLTTSSTSSLPERDVSALPFSTGGGIDATAGATTVTSLFPPERVAWWEIDNTLDKAAGEKHVMGETLQGINSVIADTATSYTTVTSEMLTYSYDGVNESNRLSCLSPHRCKKHGRQHYRCARHRARGTHIKEQYLPTGRSCHDPMDAQFQSSRAALLATSKRKEEPLANVRLLQFHSALQPPPLPSSVALGHPKQLISRTTSQETNELTSLQLLSLRAKPRVPRVRLFAWDGADGKGVEDKGKKGLHTLSTATDRSPGLLARSSSPLRELAPPVLPPSCVFTDPPPLLKLKTPMPTTAAPRKLPPRALTVNLPQQEDRRVWEVEELSNTVIAPNVGLVVPSAPFIIQQHLPVSVAEPPQGSTPRGPPSPSPLETGPSVSRFAHEDHAGLVLGGAGTPLQPRKVEELMKVDTKCQLSSVPVASPQPAATHTGRSTPSVSAVKLEPVLSPSEAVAFRKYVDELKATGVVDVPLPLAPKIGQSLPACAQSTVPVVEVAPQASEPQQEYKIIDAVKEALSLHEKRQAELFHGVIGALRSREQKFASSGVKDPPAAPQPQGLSAVEQSALVRHTIRQKDQLLMINQDLLELHARAQRLAPVAPSEVTEQSAASRATVWSKDIYHTKLSPVIPLDVPEHSNTVVAPSKGGDTTVSLGIQTGSGATKTEDASTMVTLPPPPPPQDQQQQQELLHVVNNSRVSAASVIPDLSSTMSIGHTLSSLHQINAELLRVNATADDMERAIQESRGVLHKHASLGTAHMAAVEGSLMMDAARRRTAALERQLTTLNSASVKPSWEIIQDVSAVEKNRDAIMHEGALTSHVCDASAVEASTAKGAKEVTAGRTSLSLQRVFTSEYADAKSDSALDIDPPLSSPALLEQATRHTFHLHAEEVLQMDSISTCDGAAAAAVIQEGSAQTPGQRTRGAEPTLVTGPPEPPLEVGRESKSRLCAGALPAQRMVDLGNLYKAAGSSGRKASAKKNVSPVRNSVRMSSSRKPVPERFAMYMPAAESRKTRRGCGNSGNDSSVIKPHQRLATAKPDTTTMTTGLMAEKETAIKKMVALESKSTKVPFSGRDRKRLDTLAVHTSKRLAELQRAFL